MDPDLALARRLARRDMRALEEVYELHGDRVQRLCLRILGRREDAEDVAQEVFLKLFERAHAFDGRARLSTWLHRLTVNLCLHWIERERLRRPRPLAEGEGALTDAAAGPLEAADKSEARRALAALLLRLTDEQRAVLLLRELEQLSYREIAAALSIPEGTVMSRLARAREQLVRLAAARQPRVSPRGPLLEKP
jgi:RNA polymerase sigma-70 factor (ECF subfamily)